MLIVGEQQLRHLAGHPRRNLRGVGVDEGVVGRHEVLGAQPVPNTAGNHGQDQDRAETETKDSLEAAPLWRRTGVSVGFGDPGVAVRGSGRPSTSLPDRAPGWSQHPIDRTVQSPTVGDVGRLHRLSIRSSARDGERMDSQVALSPEKRIADPGGRCVSVCSRRLRRREHGSDRRGRRGVQGHAVQSF